MQSEAGDTLSYTWYKNKAWLSSGSSPSLALPHVTVTDAASYHCTVWTPSRTRSSAPATLNVLCESPRALHPGGSPVSTRDRDSATLQGCLLVCHLSLGWSPRLGGVGANGVCLHLRLSKKISFHPRT